MEDRIQQSKHINKAIIIVSVLVVFFALIYFGSVSMLNFRHPTDGFSIKYPAKWIKVVNKDGASVIFLSPKESDLDVFQENVNVVVQNQTGAPMSLQKYTDRAIFQLKVVFKEGIKVVDSEGAYLDGKPAYKIIYETAGDPSFKIMHVWTVVGSRAYQVTFTAYTSRFEDFKDVAEKMIQSFRIR